MPEPYQKTVSVGFNPTTKQFSFSQEPVSMDQPGNIVLVKDNPNDQSWHFESATVDTAPGQFWLVANSPSTVVIGDHHTSLGSFSYTVTVADQVGNQTTSPDPHIVNDTPPPIERPLAD